VSQSDVEIANFAKATCAGNPEKIADLAGIIGINLFVVILLTQSRW